MLMKPEPLICVMIMTPVLLTISKGTPLGPETGAVANLDHVEQVQLVRDSDLTLVIMLQLATTIIKMQTLPGITTVMAQRGADKAPGMITETLVGIKGQVDIKMR